MNQSENQNNLPVDPANLQDGTPWRTLDRRLIVDRSPYARVYDEDVLLPDGNIITNWNRVDIPAFALIFAVVEQNNVPHVALVRQFRQAVGAFTLELPAGHIEDGEESAIAAARELREETGLAVADAQRDLIPLGKYIMDANRGCGWCHVFMARQAAFVTTADAGDLDTVQALLLPLDDVRARWMAGAFVSAPTALAVGLALAQL